MGGRAGQRRRLLALASAATLLAIAAATVLSLVHDQGERAPARPSRQVAEQRPRPAAGAPGREARSGVARLDRRERIGQLFAFGLRSRSPDRQLRSLLGDPGVGAIVLESGVPASPAALRALTTQLRDTADRGRRARPWVLARQSGGPYNALRGLPPDAAAGELPGPGAGAGQAGAVTRAFARVGVDGLLGPVLDVGGHDDPGVGRRALGDDARTVSAYARASVRTYERARLPVAVEHFPGLGAASQPTESGPASVGLSTEELAARDLRPFAAAVGSGAPAVLVGNGIYADLDAVTPAALSPAIVGGLLRRRLRFTGVAIADDVGAPGVTALVRAPQAAAQAVFAGADMVYVSGGPTARRAAIDAVAAAVRDGRISERRLDEAVARVITLKLRYGISTG